MNLEIRENNSYVFTRNKKNYATISVKVTFFILYLQHQIHRKFREIFLLSTFGGISRALKFLKESGKKF